MTVSELIEKLQAVPNNLEVFSEDLFAPYGVEVMTIPDWHALAGQKIVVIL